MDYHQELIFRMLLTVRAEGSPRYLGYEQVYPRRHVFPEHAKKGLKDILLYLTHVCIHGLSDQLTVPRQKCPRFPHQNFYPPPLLFQPYCSAMPRRVLALISRNIPYRKELTRYKKGVVIGFTKVDIIAP